MPEDAIVAQPEQTIMSDERRIQLDPRPADATPLSVVSSRPAPAVATPAIVVESSTRPVLVHVGGSAAFARPPDAVPTRADTPKRSFFTEADGTGSLLRARVAYFTPGAYAVAPASRPRLLAPHLRFQRRPRPSSRELPGQDRTVETESTHGGSSSSAQD